MTTNNDAKLIEFCAFTLSNEGVSLDATEYFKRLGDALGRELKVLITDSAPQLNLTDDEERRLQRAYGIAQQRMFLSTHENSKHRLDYDEYLRKLNDQN